MKKREVRELNLDEKIRLLNGVGSWHTYDCHGFVPAVTMSDGPHGLRKQNEEVYSDIHHSLPATCFPSAATIACSFDEKVASNLATALSLEAKHEGVDIVLGPGVNMKRSPLCGRNFEYFSEDPYLTGQLATAYVDAMEKSGTMTSVKHFAMNNQETNRMTSNSVVDERAMHEIYLPAFKKIVTKAHPSTIMSSYNLINGLHGSCNRYLLSYILRDKWGFDGAVISDWGGTSNIVESIKAGLDLEMPDSFGYHGDILKRALQKKEISISDIDRSVDTILTLSSKVNKNNVDINYDEQHNKAVKLAEECAVLLKNDGILPLDKNKKIVVVGDLAKNMRIQGSGSSHITCTKEENMIDILKEKGYQFEYCRGYDANVSTVDDKLHQEAVEEAKDADVILYFGGLTDQSEGEGFDRTSLYLPDNQVQLMNALPMEKTVLILFGGSPFVIPCREQANAILMMYLPGQGCARACEHLISGEVNPSGKLAESWPLKVEDTPCYGFFGKKSTNILYAESIYVGYRFYESYNIPLQYVFGYGLSYTSFEYSHLHVDERYVSFDITNRGKVAGKEVAQVYVNNNQNIRRPVKELVGFKKVELKPGETKRVEIELSETAFCIYDVNVHDFVKVDGSYLICVGSSIKDIRLTDSIIIDGTVMKEDYLKDYPDYCNAPVFTEKMFSGLFGGNMPVVELGNRPYHISDSFEVICEASALGRRIARTVHAVLPFMVKDGKDSASYKMILSSLNESHLEGLPALSSGIVRHNFMNLLINKANQERNKKKKMTE